MSLKEIRMMRCIIGKIEQKRKKIKRSQNITVNDSLFRKEKLIGELIEHIKYLEDKLYGRL